MVFITGEEGTIEVRIRSYRGRHYDEHVKIDPTQKLAAGDLKRYIIAKPGTEYYIECTLKEGFDFGQFELIQAKFDIGDQQISYAEFKLPKTGPVLAKDYIDKIQYANVPYAGRSRGSTLVFENVDVAIDDTLSEGELRSADIFPHSIPTLSLGFSFYQKVTVALSDDELKEAVSNWEEEHSSLVSTSEKPARTKETWCCGHVLEGFKFHPISAEFLKHFGIVKYPPPLYLYDWDTLDDRYNEKKLAIVQLQDLEIEYLKGTAPEMRSSRRKRMQRNDPKEWRSWCRMYGPEKRSTFETLQERLKSRESGETNLEYRNMAGEVISLEAEAQSGAHVEEAQRDEMAVATSLEDNVRAPIVNGDAAAALFQQNMRVALAEEIPTAPPWKTSAQKMVPETITCGKSEAAPLKIKSEPFEVISLDSDDDIEFLSEAKNSDVQESTKSKSLVKQEPVGSSEEESKSLQELKELQDLKQRQVKVGRKIELMKKMLEWEELEEEIKTKEAKRVKRG